MDRTARPEVNGELGHPSQKTLDGASPRPRRGRPSQPQTGETKGYVKVRDRVGRLPWSWRGTPQSQLEALAPHRGIAGLLLFLFLFQGSFLQFLVKSDEFHIV